MALNINWRFAGPQNINVPQSNFLNSLDKNIQNALGIKKEFDKKRDDNEMIRLMTEESENKLTNLINEKDELTTQYNLLTADEQLAQKTNYENKLNELDIQIAAARKEVTDARMNANQFKTTGTTDFFRWKKDKEYASDVANINRDILDKQTKESQLSDLSYEIKAKEQEYIRSNNKDEKRRLTDEINALRERYNKIYGENYYPVFVGTGNNKDTPKDNVPPNDDDIKSVEFLKNEIDSLNWEENLNDSDSVKNIQTEINKYPNDIAKDNLNQALTFKIKKLNDDKAAEDEAKRKAKAAKAAAVRKAKESAAKDLETWYKEKDPKKLLTYYNDSKNDDKELKGIAKKYLIDFLGQTNTPGLNVLNNTKARAAKQKYKDDLAMQAFIDANAAEINAIQKKK